MPNYNKTIVAGHLTRDIEVRHTPSGTAVGKTGIAVNSKMKDQTKTLFLDCVLFGKGAEIAAKYLTKGSPALFDGRLETQEWKSDNGEQKSRIVLIVNDFQFLGGNKPAKESASDMDDIPF